MAFYNSYQYPQYGYQSQQPQMPQPMAQQIPQQMPQQMAQMPQQPVVVSGEERIGSRSIFTPAEVDEYGNVTSRATVDVPRGCCFTVAVEYVNGTVDDPTVVPTPLINVIDGSLSITRTA